MQQHTYYQNLFSKKVVCAECGATMTYVRKNKGDGKWGLQTAYYTCSREKQAPCRQIVYEDRLKMIVLEHLKNIFIYVCGQKSLIQSLQDGTNEKSVLRSYEKKLVNLKRKQQDVEALILSIYKDLAEKVINEEEYQLLNARYMKEKRALQELIERLDEVVFKMRRWIDSFENLGEQFSYFLSDNVSSQAIIEETVSKVIVSADGSVELVLNCEDVIARFRSLLEDEHEKIAMYLRRSLPDITLGLNGKEGSNSIENQRLLIRNYLETREELVGEVLEYKDDGYSGMNFERPGFKQMIQDAKRGIIGTIIVKDLSRFGREYIGMGDYMEQILPSLGVRLIAINSKYDSQAQGAGAFSMDVSINNMINNMYSRDLSKKLRSSFKAKWNSGIDTSGSVPFGYKREKSDLGVCLVIDQTAAEIVRTIFALANKGYYSKEIAEYLNAHDVPTPLLYRQK